MDQATLEKEQSGERQENNTARPSNAGGSRGREFLSRYWPLVSTAAIIVGALLLGSAVSNPLLFPPLPELGEALVTVFAEQYPTMLLTFGRFLVALTIAAGAAWIVGLLMGAFRSVVGRLLRPLMAFLQAVPALTWVLLSVLWIQSIEVRIFFVTFIVAFPLFVIAIYEGIRDMDNDLLEAIEQFRPNRWQVVRILLTPQSLVNLLTSLRVTAPLTLQIMVFAELIAATSGIGQAFGTAQTHFRVDVMFAWTLVLVLAVFALSKGIDLLERILLRWRTEAVVR